MIICDNISPSATTSSESYAAQSASNFTDAASIVVTSDAQNGRSATTQFRYKVFLMTVGDRYQPYEMKITDDKVYFTLIGSKSK